MTHKLSHVVRVADTQPYWVSHTHHPVTWCATHVREQEWQFTLELKGWAETYVFMFVFMFMDQNIATQFALLYG